MSNDCRPPACLSGLLSDQKLVYNEQWPNIIRTILLLPSIMHMVGGYVAMSAMTYCNSLAEQMLTILVYIQFLCSCVAK